MKLRPYTSNGAPAGYWHWCPACEALHGISVQQKNNSGAVWRFDGNFDRPTFSPSIRCFATEEDGSLTILCHYFINSGMIQFCGDNPHELNGQTVPLPDIPEGLFRNG